MIDPAAIVQGETLGYRLPRAMEIIREACPFCGSQPGEPCRERGSNRIMRAFHAKRMRLAAYTPKGTDSD